MNKLQFTSARNTQIVISLLKANHIRKVIASPGTQNMSLVLSMQQDSFFEMYSAADERSAAYMACGMAAISKEPVVLSCTGATASRNYLPGLTEAYYRHLPIVAITSTERTSSVGHDIPQIIDRSSFPNDVCKISVKAPLIVDEDDEWHCTIEVNRALQEIFHHGTGPVHINLEKVKNSDFSVSDLPQARVIKRISEKDNFPQLPYGRKAIFVGAHVVWAERLIEIVDRFCSENNAVVFCDHTSNYNGLFRVQLPLIASQDYFQSPIFNTELIIQLGDISGDYYQAGRLGKNTKQVWRVNEDGEIKDTFRKLSYVFEMDECTFFSKYIEGTNNYRDSYLSECKSQYSEFLNAIPELPFGNIWIAQNMAPLVPPKTSLHFGILNSLRSWNFFEIDKTISCFCNVGGFGIDGGLSSLIGASLAKPEQVHFGIFGDLAFFYDMNSLGNRHIGNNIRILLINNAKGSEFKLYHHPASKFEEYADLFIAAGGHYGRQSPFLVKHYAEDLGFEYIFADTKESFLQNIQSFVDPQITVKPMLMEVFTDSQDESDSLKFVNSIKKSNSNRRKEVVKSLIGERMVHTLRNFISKLPK